MDWIAGITLLLAYIFTGKNKWWGWLLSVIGNLLWLYIGLVYDMGGLWTISVIMTIIAFFNMIKWWKRRKG